MEVLYQLVITINLIETLLKGVSMPIFIRIWTTGVALVNFLREVNGYELRKS